MTTNLRGFERRIRALGRKSAMHQREAEILRDMAAAERKEVAQQLDFLERHLPEPPTGALTGRNSLIGSPAELAAARRRTESDPVSAQLAGELVASSRKSRRVGGPDWIDWRARRRPQLWTTRSAHWAFARALDGLAWDWRLNGTRAAAATVKGVLLALAGTRHGWLPLGCNYGNPYRGWLNDNLLDLGHATLAPAIAYDAVRPLLTRAERTEIAAYFEPFFYRALSHRHYGIPHPGHNFAPVGFGGNGLLALALWEDVAPERRAVLGEVVAWAEAYTRFILDTVGGSDGAAVEGSGYGSASLRYVALFAEGLRQRCGRDLFQHPGWGRFARYLVLETLPEGGAFNNFNDNNYTTTTGFWPLVARRSGDPIADWVWFHHDGPQCRADVSRHALGGDAPYILLFRNPSHDGLRPEQAGVRPVHTFRDQHHWVARTGWEPSDLHVSFQCTRGRAGGHSQRDRLNFTVYALGERFVIDSGYGMEKIPGSSEVRRLGKLAESHNQVLVDGQGQRDTIAADAGRIVRTGADGGWVWAVGDAIGAYEGLTRARRCVLVRRTAADPVVIIVDWIVPSKPGAHRFEWLLHTAQGNRFIPGPGGGFAIRGGRKGRSLQCLQAVVGRITRARDHWIDHPRLCLMARGREYVALTVLTVGRTHRAGGRGKGLSAGWTDGQGTGRAALNRRRSKNGGGIIELAVEGLRNPIAL